MCVVKVQSLLYLCGTTMEYIYIYIYIKLLLEKSISFKSLILECDTRLIATSIKKDGTSLNNVTNFITCGGDSDVRNLSL